MVGMLAMIEADTPGCQWHGRPPGASSVHSESKSVGEKAQGMRQAQGNTELTDKVPNTPTTA